jgi:hypothetical protein
MESYNFVVENTLTKIHIQKLGSNKMLDTLVSWNNLSFSWDMIAPQGIKG